MRGAALEQFLARLYTDAALRQRFLADPATAARAAGLDADEIAAMLRVDATDLELCAASFAYKRQHARRRRWWQRWRRP